MPDESCRTCGGELVINQMCPDCKKSNQKKCGICSNITPVQPHEFCGNAVSNQKYSLIQVIQKKKTIIQKLVRVTMYLTPCAGDGGNFYSRDSYYFIL